MTLLNAIALLALVGAGLVLFPRFGSRWGFALVLVSLAAALHWYDRLNTGERWAFWLVFAIMAFHTFFARWPGRRRIGSGAVMLVFTIILLLFDISGWWLFWTLLMLVVLFIAVAFLKPLVIGVAALLAAILLMTGWISTWDLGGDSNKAAPKPGSTQSASPTGGATTGTGTATAAPCPPAYVQKPYTRGDMNRMVVNGIATLLPDKGKNATPSEKIDAYLKATGRDATLLAAYAWNEGVWTDANDTKPLLTADGKCLSAQGQKVHDMLEGAWKSGSNLIANSPTPTNGTNSGISKGKVVVSSHSGMDKGRTGLKVIHPNGRVTFIDDACGNLVFLTAPPKSIPKGPTDQPKLEAKKPAEDSMNNPSRPAQEKGTAPSVSSGASAPAAGTPQSTPYTAPAAPVGSTATATAVVTPEASASPSSSPEPAGDPCNTVPKPTYC